MCILFSIISSTERPLSLQDPISRALYYALFVVPSIPLLLLNVSPFTRAYKIIQPYYLFRTPQSTNPHLTIRADRSNSVGSSPEGYGPFGLSPPRVRPNGNIQSILFRLTLASGNAQKLKIKYPSVCAGSFEVRRENTSPSVHAQDISSRLHTPLPSPITHHFYSQLQLWRPHTSSASCCLCNPSISGGWS